MKHKITLCLKLIIFSQICVHLCSGSHHRHHHGSSVTPLFGFGVGYKKVSTYVPVLTFQTRKKKPHHANSDVLFINPSNNPGASVTVSGNDVDSDQSGERLSSGGGFTDGGQSSQNLATNGGVRVQYHNLRSDDNQYGRNEILHSDRRPKYNSRQRQFHKEEDSQDFSHNYKNTKHKSKRNDIRDHTPSNYNRFRDSSGESVEDSDSENSEEMNEYTIGDFNWDWKPKRGNRHIFNGRFSRFFGNRPRTYY